MVVLGRNQRGGGACRSLCSSTVLATVLLVLVGVATLLPCAATRHYVIPEGEPLADSRAISIGSKAARFTVLSSAMIRCEYDVNGIGWEDRQTMIVINRRVPVPKFSVRRLEGGGVCIETSEMKLTYTGGTFTGDSLFVDL